MLRASALRCPRPMLASLNALPFRAQALHLGRQQLACTALSAQPLQARCAAAQSVQALVPSAREETGLAPGLYLVATPIGNLEDITIRALRVLRQADTVFAEDCRHTLKLAQHYGFSARLVSYHAHNEASRQAQISDLLARGLPVALVSDAGTPGVSDPGARAVAAAVAAGHTVVPIPGPCAALAALTASGLATDEFLFVGFLPAKAVARRKRLDALRASCMATMVMYVPPHGIDAQLADMREVFGDERRCVIARELTKVYESFLRGTLAEMVDAVAEQPLKGELTVLVAGSTAQDMRAVKAEQAPPEERLRQLLSEGNSVSASAKIMAAEYGMRRREAYNAGVAEQARMCGAAEKRKGSGPSSHPEQPPT